MCGRDDRGTRSGGDGEVLRIVEPADVVPDDRARAARFGEHRGPPRVDRERDIQAGVERSDRRHHPVELLGLADLGPGPGLHPAHVEQVGAVDHQLLGPSHQGIELEGQAGVVERVGGSVEDPHHEGAVGDVVDPITEAVRRSWVRRSFPPGLHPIEPTGASSDEPQELPERRPDRDEPRTTLRSSMLNGSNDAAAAIPSNACTSATTGARSSADSAGAMHPGHAPDHPGRETTDRDRTHQRCGEHVGRQRCEREVAEDGEQHRRDTDLRGKGDGERVAQRMRSCEPSRDRRREQRDPDRRAARQRETRRSGPGTDLRATTPIAASASSRSPDAGRPRNPANIAPPAIATARNTDGSQRVIVPKTTITTRPTTNRPRNPSRRSSGATSASTNATFSPETAR